MSGFGFWRSLASLAGFDASPVSAFPHAPVSWDFDRNIFEGLIVEAPYSTDDSTHPTACWFAVVVRKAGYFVCLKWLGDERKPRRYFWRHVAAFEKGSGNQSVLHVFPLGWAKANKQRLEPPMDIRHLRLDWASFLEEQLQARRTLPESFHDHIKEDNKSCFEKGMMVEATAIDRSIALKLAVVEGDIGRRIKFRYLGDSGITNFCWFHEFSEMFFPCGWARFHGRQLISTLDNYEADLKPICFDQPPDDQASILHFKPLLIPDFAAEALKSYRFEPGSKLEVIDPFEPRFICVGTFVRALENQYLVIEIDGVLTPDGSDKQVCLHASSPYLLPAGFAAENNLQKYFRPPRADFSYKNTDLVPRKLFQRVIPRHDLRRNQYLEVAASAGGDGILVSRIADIIGHLVLIHFEGYSSEEDRFYPLTSSELYPVGWCHLVGHQLQIPPPHPRPLR